MYKTQELDEFFWRITGIRTYEYIWYININVFYTSHICKYHSKHMHSYIHHFDFKQKQTLLHLLFVNYRCFSLRKLPSKITTIAVAIFWQQNQHTKHTHIQVLHILPPVHVVVALADYFICISWQFAYNFRIRLRQSAVLAGWMQTWA